MNLLLIFYAKYYIATLINSNFIQLQFLKPKDIDFKPRRTKAKGKGGTAKVVKSKKILKQLAKRVSLVKLIIF